MLKKRYLIIGLAIVSVLLGSLALNNGIIFGETGKPVKEVHVINFPENSMTLTVIPNGTFADALSNFTLWRTYAWDNVNASDYYLTVNVDGWKKVVAHLYWFNPDYNYTIHRYKAPEMSPVQFRLEDVPIHYGMYARDLIGSEHYHIWIIWRNGGYLRGGKHGISDWATWEVTAPLLDIFIRNVRTDYPIGNATIALSLYLTR